MNLSRLLISAGVTLIVLGGLVWLAGRVPGLNRLGRLPGDLRVEGNSFRFYFPWVTCLLLSAVLTLLSYLWGRFKG